VGRVQILVCSDQGVGVKVTAEELNMSRETVWQIVKEDLGTRKISAKMLPQILDTWPETSASHFIYSFMQHIDVWYGHFQW
jgi:orotate phosphoribosyltransferase-like protein